jgi:competence protein ComEC
MEREILQRRCPALWAALAFAAGIAAANYSEIAPGWLYCLVPILWIAAYCCRNLCWACTAVLLALFVALGALRYQSYTQLLPFNHIANHAQLFARSTVRGRIAEEVERDGERTRFVLALEQVETDSVLYEVCGRVLVTLRSGYLRADYGDRVQITGHLRRPARARNPGAFDYRRYLVGENIHAVLSARSMSAVAGVESLAGAWPMEVVVLPLRRYIRAAIGSNLEGAAAGLLLGVLLGEKRQVPTEVRDQFRSAGLAHALVVSGMHVGIVAVFVLNALRLCGIALAPSQIGTMVFLFVYAAVTQANPPVVRAVIVACVVLTGRLVEREGDIYNSLGLAALCILALWPASLLGLSFQLSFVATFAIVGLHGPLLRIFPARWRDGGSWRGQYIALPICVSLAAQMGTGPLIALYFQQWSPIGLLANLVVAPLLAAALGLGLLTLIFYAWLPLLATVFNAANYLVLTALVAFVQYCATLPGAALDVPKPDVFFLVFIACAYLLIARMPNGVVARKRLLFLLLVWLNISVWNHVFRSRNLEVIFLDMGQGDAAFLRFPDGKTMVVDGGHRSPEYDHGARVLLPFLRQHNIRRVDVVVASHPHSDHIGGLVALLEEIEVGHYIDSGQQYDSWTAGRLRQLITKKNIRYQRVAAGDSLLGLGGVGGLVLHPTPVFVDSAGTSPHGLNNGSVVFKLSYDKVDILFTGDIEKETDAALLAWGPRLRANILKVAHHGSRTSSQAAFVEAVGAEWAVISVGQFNTFGHPAAEVLARFAKRQVKVLRTDRRGAVLLSSNGRDIEIETMVNLAAVGR